MTVAARSMVRSLFVGVVVAAALSACGKKDEAPSASSATQPAAEEKVLNLSIWNDYLADDTIEGPALIVQHNSTTLVPPAWVARVATHGDIVIAKQGAR